MRKICHQGRAHVESTPSYLHSWHLPSQQPYLLGVLVLSFQINKKKNTRLSRLTNKPGVVELVRTKLRSNPASRHQSDGILSMKCLSSHHKLPKGKENQDHKSQFLPICSWRLFFIWVGDRGYCLMQYFIFATRLSYSQSCNANVYSHNLLLFTHVTPKFK